MIRYTVVWQEDALDQSVNQENGARNLPTGLCKRFDRADEPPEFAGWRGRVLGEDLDNRAVIPQSSLLAAGKLAPGFFSLFLKIDEQATDVVQLVGQ